MMHTPSSVMRGSLRTMLSWTLMGVAFSADALVDGFVAPPEATKPGVYWYWLNNHISDTGITRDLEAMKSVGIGAAFIGHVADTNIPYGDTPLLGQRWWDMMAHAVKEGGRIGVDIGMFNCPGWSQSGGPWMKPEQSMRYIVSQDLRVHGPGTFSGPVPRAEGALQDVALLAYPVAADDAVVVRPSHVVAPAGAEDWQALTRAGVPGSLTIPSTMRNNFAIELSYDAPLTAQALVLDISQEKSRFHCIVSVRDGEQWRQIREMDIDRSNRSPNIGPLTGGQVVMSVPTTTATTWKIAFKDVAEKGNPVANLYFTAAARVDRYVEKQLGAMHPTPTPPWNWYRWDTVPEPTGAPGVDPKQVIDLSARLTSAGTLEWTIPPGDWVLSRVSMKSTGVKNGPTAPEATGPECDKMSVAAVEAMFDGMLGEIIRRVPAEQRKALRYAILDSYEVGSQNWTDGFAKLFEQTYGYDPKPWLPCLQGRMVGSAERSDRFLWDLRRLIADEVGRSYVGGLKSVANRHGLRTWLENYGHWGFPGEFMKYGAHSDEIAGEFWLKGTLGNIECRAAASTAHAYGFPRVSAESYTDHTSFDRHPALLKARGDWSYCEGINHVVLHVYVHQPYEAAPGITPWFGQQFNRHNDWFMKHGKTWIDYQRRCCFLLQQGAPVADVSYFLGEDAPMMTGPQDPPLPAGYDFDFINGELIRDRLSLQNGRWVLPGGASYRLLVLPPIDALRPEVLTRIRDLVQQGGAILGLPPTHSPSLAGWPQRDADVRHLAEELWGHDVGNGPGERTCGKGRVFWRQDVAAVLAKLGESPDVEPGSASLLWKHRRTSDADIYFISNQSDAWLDATPSFRVQGRQPEVWNAVDGSRRVTGFFQGHDGRTQVPVALEPHGSCFVVFRGSVSGHEVVKVLHDGAPADLTSFTVSQGDHGLVAQVRSAGRWQFGRADGRSEALTVASLPAPVSVLGPWQVAFQENRGAPAKITLERLQSLSEHADPGVKYFSGTATWQASFTMPSVADPVHTRWELDLGRVGVMAAVRLNGIALGTWWQPPLRADVTAALRPGENHVEVEVTTTWVNRLVGDTLLPQEAQGGIPAWVRGGEPRPASGRWAFACANPVRPGTKLVEAGLVGPVTLRASAVEDVP